MLFSLTMWNAGIGVDFVVDVLGFEVFSSLLEDFFREELVVFWLLR